jgi:hypothetical protein
VNPALCRSRTRLALVRSPSPAQCRQKSAAALWTTCKWAQTYWPGGHLVQHCWQVIDIGSICRWSLVAGSW